LSNTELPVDGGFVSLKSQAFLINVALGMGLLRPPAKVSFAQQPVSVELSSASLAEIVQTDS
jgi:hypothetical protein